MLIHYKTNRSIQNIMEMMKYFFECCFNASEYFDSLDKIIDKFKLNESYDCKYSFIKELYHIIQTKNYDAASRIIEKYSDKLLNIKQTEKVIIYIYNKLLDNPVILDISDFYKNCKAILCPICSSKPRKKTTVSLIDKATIIDNNMQIYICKPCQLVWTTQKIKKDNAQDYKKFMRTFGLKGLWKELKDVDTL